MRKIINLVVVSMLFCLCLFVDVNAEGAAFPLIEDDIETEVGQFFSKDVYIVLASDTIEETWDYQDSISFDYTVIDETALLDPDLKQPLLDIVKSFFSAKLLPDGLEVTSFELQNPLDINIDPGDYYYGTLLKVTIEGKVPETFDITGYQDDLIELTISKDYLIECEIDSLTQHPTYSTGKYKLYRAYKVIFDTQGHGIAPKDQKVKEGEKATKPSDPSESGYTFLGWYKEPECLNVYDFETEVIVEDTIIYAKWEEYIPPYIPPVVEEETPTFAIPNTGIE